MNPLLGCLTMAGLGGTTDIADRLGTSSFVVVGIVEGGGWRFIIS